MLNEILQGLTNILGPIATASKDRSQMKDEALRAICHALDETYLYYRDIGHGRLQTVIEKQCWLNIGQQQE